MRSMMMGSSRRKSNQIGGFKRNFEINEDLEEVSEVPEKETVEKVFNEMEALEKLELEMEDFQDKEIPYFSEK